MILAAHQPNFIPWLGYYDKMSKADVFITVDHVQMERQSFQNRVRIKTGEGPRWITVPVVQESRNERIVDKRVDNSRSGRFRWSRKMFLTLKYAYQAAPFYKEHEAALQGILEDRWDSLAELNGRLIDFCRNALDIRTRIVRSSSLPVSGAKSEMVLSLCRAVGADVYLAGDGASRAYLDLPAFERAGVRVMWQEFTHPVYRQYPSCDEFVPNMSALDLIFNCGPRSPEILRGGIHLAPASPGAEK